MGTRKMDTTGSTRKIAIAIPNEGVTRPESYDNHLAIAFHLGKLETEWKQQKRTPRYEFYWFTVGRILTPLARERLVEEAIKSDMDYIVMFDDDMLLPIDMFERLIEDMEKHPEIDILAPLAFMRNPPYWAVIYNSIEGYDEVVHKPYHNMQQVKNYPKDTLVEADATGFGAVMIKMDVIKKMKKPYFFSTSGTGEDVYFCVKAKKEADARVFIDTRIKLGHLRNPEPVDEEVFEAYHKEKKTRIREKPYKYNDYKR